MIVFQLCCTDSKFSGFVCAYIDFTEIKLNKKLTAVVSADLAFFDAVSAIILRNKNSSCIRSLTDLSIGHIGIFSASDIRHIGSQNRRGLLILCIKL